MPGPDQPGLEQWRFDWDRPCTRDEWLEVLPAFGGHGQIPPVKAIGSSGGSHI